MQQNHRFQLLDVYRGIAALLVVLFHITTEAWYKFNHYVFLGSFFNFGSIGVDFFFVLSGFILFYIHYKDKSNPKNVINFFKKRFIRIFPSYWLIVTAVVLTYILFNINIIDKVPLTFSHLFATYTLLPHIKRFIYPSWTLTEELYFYCIFGFLLFIPSNKIRITIFLLIAIGLFIISFFVTSDVVSTIPNLMEHAFLVPYAIEFACGCLAGYIFSYITKKIKISHFIAICIFSFIILVIGLLIHSYFNFFILLATFAFTLLVWATGALEASYTFQVNKFLLLIGKASYIIYLMHIFIFKIVEKLSYGLFRIPNNQLILFSLCMGGFILCVIIPIPIYLFYDKPMQYFLRRKLLAD